MSHLRLLILLALLLLTGPARAEWGYPWDTGRERQRAERAEEAARQYQHQAGSAGLALIIVVLVGGLTITVLATAAYNFARKRIRIFRTPAHSVISGSYVVDGLNVAMDYPSFRHARRIACLPVLLTLLVAIRKRGWSFTCFLDATAPHRFREAGEPAAENQYRALLRDFPEWFVQTPAGTRADDFILDRSHRTGEPVVSNDRFQDYMETYPWLRQAGDRHLRGTVQGDILNLPGLGIAAPVLTLPEAVRTLRELLESAPREASAEAV